MMNSSKMILTINMSIYNGFYCSLIVINGCPLFFNADDHFQKESEQKYLNDTTTTNRFRFDPVGRGQEEGSEKKLG